MLTNLRSTKIVLNLRLFSESYACNRAVI